MLNRFALSAALAVVTANAGHAQVLYGSTSSGGPGELYLLNPANGAVVQDVGSLKDAGGANYPMTGLAFNPLSGVLYGSTGNSVAATATRLVTINPATAQVTVIGTYNAGNTGNPATMSDLAFTASGQLYGIASNGGANLYSINLLTGQATLVGNSGVAGTAGGGIAISAAGVVYGSPVSPRFGTYDSVSGLFTDIGNLTTPAGANTGYAALAFNGGGVLFGDDLGPTPHLVTINLATAAVTDLGTSVVALDAIAFSVPVPEPSSLLLCGLAAASAAMLRRRSPVRPTVRT